MNMAQWDLYPNFSKHEFMCRHTGREEMRHDFMEKLQKLRTEYGKPLAISSGYRDPTHPVERAKSRSGAHSSGCACDIVCQGAEAYRILELAIKHGFERIGIHQKGTHRFIHLDTLKHAHFPTPTIWSY